MPDPRLIALACATFGIGTQTYAFSGALAPLAAALGVSVATAGQMVLAYGVAFALAGPLLAAVFGRADRRALLVAALAVVSVLNLAAALAEDFESLVVIRVGTALVAAIVNPLASATAVALAPPEARGRALALVLGGLTIAFVAGIPLGSVASEFWGWRGAFALGAGVTALAAVAVLAALPPIAGQAEPPLRRVAEAVRPRVLHVLSLSLIGFAASFPVVAYLGPVVTAVTGLEGARIGALQTLVGFGSLAGIVIGGRLADRAEGFDAAPWLFLGIGATQIGFALLLEGWLPAGAAAIALVGLVIFLSAASQFALMPMIQARAILEAGEGRHVALALNGSLIMLGQGVGAAIGGLAQHLGGLAATGFAGAAVSLLGLAVALTAARSAPASPTLPPYPHEAPR